MSARDYVVEVWTDNVMVRDEAEPAIRGVIHLTDEEYSQLDSRLYALEGEDHVYEYSINEVEDLARFTQDGILSFLAGLDDTPKARDIRDIWNKVR